MWGVYGGLTSGGREWYLPYPQGTEALLQERIKRMGATADWVLLDLRRHYCNTLISGGGLLFPTDSSQARYDYLKSGLDKCADYGIGWVPST